MNRIAEQWKPVKGFKNYRVSNLGRVKSVDHYANSKGGTQTFRHGSLVKGFPTNCGYVNVRLSTYINGKQKMKNCLVYRLVAEAFIPNPTKLPQVNHIDGNKENNNVANLEWVSRSTNVQHAYRHHLAKRNKPVYCYDLDNVLIKTYSSMRQAERDGFQSSGISEACHGRKRNHIYRGRIWRLASEVRTSNTK